jgi:diguanylate cyclase (GGDEF)-like protein/PAS domain S-box-containing protein
MEVADALAAEGLDNVDVVPLRARCLGGITQAAAFREQADDLLRRYERVVAIGGPCVTGEDFSDLWDEGLRIVPTQHCWGPLADGELLSSLIAEGAYVVTPGWLSHWPERMADWGFSQEQAREFFHDCCSSMVLLDTQVDPESGRRLAEVTAFLGLPSQRFPLSLGYVRLFLARTVAEWRLDQCRSEATLGPTDSLVESPAATDEDLRSELADYAMAMDLLAQMASVRSEDQLTMGIADLATRLFGSRDSAYVPVERAAEADGPLIAQALGSAAEYGWNDEGTTFWVKVGQPGEPLGILTAGDFYFPRYGDRYLNLAIGLARVLALAVSNARSFQELVSARDALRVSEEKYRVLINEAGDAILILDERGVIVEMNRKALSMLRMTAEETHGKSVISLVAPNRTRRMKNALTTTLEKGGTFLSSAELVTADTKPVSVDMMWSRVFLTGGTAVVQLVVRDITERRLAEERLRSLALVDQLTGLNNRRGFTLLAQQQLKVCDRAGHGASLVYIDLDGMKAINDELGHKEGDHALRQTAQVLRQTFRAADILARLGGDEFVALIAKSDPETERVILNRLDDVVEERNRSADLPFALSLSVGAASYDPQAPLSIEELLQRADAMMYEEKRLRRVKGC